MPFLSQPPQLTKFLLQFRAFHTPFPYGTAGPFRYKVLLEDFWDWCDSEDDDDDLD